MKYHPLANPVCCQFYLAKDEKDDFKKACWQRDTTMSREIRRMIREYTYSDVAHDRFNHPSLTKP
jgi:hypothetical protein